MKKTPAFRRRFSLLPLLIKKLCRGDGTVVGIDFQSLPVISLVKINTDARPTSA
jgi:hypothetical protein